MGVRAELAHLGLLRSQIPGQKLHFDIRRIGDLFEDLVKPATSLGVLRVATGVAPGFDVHQLAKIIVIELVDGA